jgi:hypothetical protein
VLLNVSDFQKVNKDAAELFATYQTSTTREKEEQLENNILAARRDREKAHKAQQRLEQQLVAQQTKLAHTQAELKTAKKALASRNRARPEPGQSPAEQEERYLKGTFSGFLLDSNLDLAMQLCTGCPPPADPMNVHLSAFDPTVYALLSFRVV